MPRALIACVGEDQSAFHAKMLNLVLSIRRYGETLADAPIVVNVVRSVNDGFRAQIEQLGAECRVVLTMDPRLPVSNKLRMLELDRDDFDVLVMLDCDVIVRGDLSPELDATTLRAAPAEKNHLNDGAWERLYERLGLRAPTDRVRSGVTGELGYPYWNSGVLFIPREQCAPLRAMWASLIDKVLAIEDDREIAAFRKDQIPFACSLAALEYPVRALPARLNLTTTQIYPPDVGGPAYVLHYHRSIDDAGFIKASPNRVINGYLDEFNRCRAEHFGQEYVGLTPLSARARVRMRRDASPLWWRLKRRTRTLRRIRKLQRAVRRRVKRR